MEIDYWDEDFSSEDVEEIDDLDELADMAANLDCEIENAKEKIKVYRDNLKVVEARISEVKHET